jgi:immune inhibitor A
VACNRFGARKPVTTFTDAKTWYPGIEYRPDLATPENPGTLFFRDNDASTVVPSKGNEIYSTRVVDAKGRLVRDLFGTDMGGGHVLGTGNPRDGRPAVEGHPGTYADLSLGVKIDIVRTLDRNRQVLIKVRPGHRSTSSSLAGSTR